jgi:hypothetical protein
LTLHEYFSNTGLFGIELLALETGSLETVKPGILKSMD